MIFVSLVSIVLVPILFIMTFKSKSMYVMLVTFEENT